MFAIYKRDPAVSPVIGTILLVAITVVLIAIIGAVVMSLADAEDGKKVGMNAQAASGADAKLILYGGDSLSELVKLEMIDQDSPYGSYIEIWNLKTNGSINVGHPYLAEKVAQPPEDMSIYDTRINVKGTFSDGREVILLVQPMTFFDVEGSDENPDNKIITPPEIGKPTFDFVTSTSFTVYLPYSNADPQPSSAIIYYTNMSSGETLPITTSDLDIVNSRFIATVTGATGNTTYDVKGDIIVKKTTFIGTKNNTVKTVTPILEKPTFMTGSNLGADYFITYFVYKNTDAPPSSLTIYYKDLTHGGTIKNVTVTGITGSPIKATINGLTEKTKYEVWGEMMASGGKFSSKESNNIDTQTPQLEKPTFMDGSNLGADFIRAEFVYRHTDARPSSFEVYYRDVTHGGSVQNIIVTDITTSPIKITIDGLTEKTKYEVWANMTSSSGVYESKDKNTVYTRTPELDAPTFMSGSNLGADFIRAEFVYRHTDAPPTSVKIYYQDVTNNGPVLDITMAGITGSPIKRTIEGLSPSTTYKVWAEMTTSSGTYPSKGSNTVTTKTA